MIVCLSMKIFMKQNIHKGNSHSHNSQVCLSYSFCIIILQKKSKVGLNYISCKADTANFLIYRLSCIYNTYVIKIRICDKSSTC